MSTSFPTWLRGTAMRGSPDRTRRRRCTRPRMCCSRTLCRCGTPLGCPSPNWTLARWGSGLGRRSKGM
ncbi:hypothetical protein DT076_16555 [Desertihabitans brevis]|uniref:Uncharacterized protein n=1 Tax=Desertihabitans brevis TaxID=2268447 RepID=A0A367YRT1_9ACTN|nr:hypothetical protein DT076_16555 [Desertihabitans brevis]